MTEKSYISVSELNLSIKSCFDSFLFKNLEIYGEISGFKISGAHAYFTLKDKNSQVSCVCFYCAKTYRPKDGECVILRGSVDYWVKGGRLNFQAVEIKPQGQGLLAIEFEKLKAQLKAEGLFSQEHKKQIPKYCKRVLVVTSKTGAVIRDIVTTVRRKNPLIDIVVRDVRVQGDGAAFEIAKVLKVVDKLGFDAVVVARGGGSLEDLAPFYDEYLARTIFDMDTPIISAIGHETDFSLCDFVADYRAPTPTSAGEFVAYDFYQLQKDVFVLNERMKFLINNNFKRKILSVQLQSGKLQNLSTKFYSNKKLHLLTAMQKLNFNVNRNIKNKENKFSNVASKLDSLSPIKTLARGYYGVSKNGKPLQNVSKLQIGDVVQTTGKDGKFLSRVEEISVLEDL